MEADRYEALDIIGKGSFGIIRRVRRKSDGQVSSRSKLQAQASEVPATDQNSRYYVAKKYPTEA